MQKLPNEANVQFEEVLTNNTSQTLEVTALFLSPGHGGHDSQSGLMCLLGETAAPKKSAQVQNTVTSQPCISDIIPWL